MLTFVCKFHCGHKNLNKNQTKTSAIKWQFERRLFNGVFQKISRFQRGSSFQRRDKILITFKSTTNPTLSKPNKIYLPCRYWLSAGSDDSLSVHVYLNGELGPAVWCLSGAPSTGWEVVGVTISSPAKFRVNSQTQFLILGTFFKWAINLLIFGLDIFSLLRTENSY